MTRLCWLASFVLVACRFEDVPPRAGAPDTAAQAPPASVPEVASPAADEAPDVGQDATAPPTSVAVRSPERWASDPSKAPYSIHMTWEGDTDARVVFTWATQFNDVSALVPKVLLQPKAQVDAAGRFDWGPATVFEGDGVNYRESLLGVDLSEDTHVVWTVRAAGLEPDTDYVWRVGFGDISLDTGALADPNWSDVGFVQTAPVKGSRTPFSFVVAGDSRGGEGEIGARMESSQASRSCPSASRLAIGSMSSRKGGARGSPAHGCGCPSSPGSVGDRKSVV